MDRKIRAYFKREFFRRTTAARVLDGLLAAFLLWYVFYRFFQSILPDGRGALPLSVVAGTTALFSLWLIQSIRLDRFIKKRTGELRQEALLWHLALLSNNAMMDILLSGDHSIRSVKPLGGGFFAKKQDGGTEYCALLLRHPSEKVFAGEILSARRQQELCGADTLTVCTTAPLCAEASDALARLNARGIGPTELIRLAEPLGLIPDDEALSAAVTEQLKRKAGQRSTFKNTLVLPGTARRYAFTGALLLALSLLTRYSVYYVMSAIVCLILAVLSLLASRLSRNAERVTPQ